MFVEVFFQLTRRGEADLAVREIRLAERRPIGNDARLRLEPPLDVHGPRGRLAAHRKQRDERQEKSSLRKLSFAVHRKKIPQFGPGRRYRTKRSGATSPRR